MRIRYRVGIGFDAHRLASGRELRIGGALIPHSRGLLGHSDGDVLLHALTDALLGAVAAPDIGSLFPSQDARWEGAPSGVFVERAMEIVAEEGFRVAQIDAVILAEEPRLASFFPEIRSAIARLLRVSEDVIGVKAKTMEGLGAIGRGEGMAAQAIVLVEKEEP